MYTTVLKFSTKKDHMEKLYLVQSDVRRIIFNMQGKICEKDGGLYLPQTQIKCQLKDNTNNDNMCNLFLDM